MNVTTEDKNLRTALSNSADALREYGSLRGKLLLMRVRTLLDAETLEDVRYMPGHFHELTGDRKGNGLAA